jgi:HNH endonuclease
MPHYYKSSVRCHLCSLPIPPEIISNVHPLFGTIDHIKPKAHGGTDAACNRAPAHRSCNAIRGTRDITPVLRVELQAQALAHFAKLLPRTPDTARWRWTRKLVALLSRRLHAQPI